jgi:very-short-patch-repair endonuclease
VQETTLLTEVFELAYTQLHFDPATHADIRPELPKASYEDLLSYFNQRHHDELDRYAVQPALKRLMACSPQPVNQQRNYDEHFQHLYSQTDEKSPLERQFLNHLRNGGLALPDRAQVNLSAVTGHFISADFLYNGNGMETLVFVDGSVHDAPEQKADDLNKRTILRDKGYDVIEWHYATDLNELTTRRKDVFRKVK